MQLLPYFFTNVERVDSTALWIGMNASSLTVVLDHDTELNHVEQPSCRCDGAGQDGFRHRLRLLHE